MQHDRRMARSRMAVQSGGIQAAINYLAANETPQMLIVEASETGPALMERIESLAEVCDPNSNVILIGAENDITLYRELKGLGLSEYFYGDVTTEQIVGAIESVFSGDTEEHLGSVIAFMGARGGVGSSVLAANAAHRLGQEFKDDVLLIDCDLAFGTAALTCNVQPKQSLADALAQPGRLDETLVERVQLKVDDYLSLVPAPGTLGGDYDIDVESFEVLMQIARGMASYVVLDLPHQWSPWIQDVMLDADNVVLTTTPDLGGMRDTKNIGDIVSRGNRQSETLHLALNKVGASRKTEISAKDFRGQIGYEPLVSIPWDPLVFGTSMNDGKLIDKVPKHTKVMAEINKLAQTVSGTAPLTKAEAKAKVRQKGGRRSALSALRFAR